MRTPQSESEFKYLMEDGARKGANSVVEWAMELVTIERLL